MDLIGLEYKFYIHKYLLILQISPTDRVNIIRADERKLNAISDTGKRRWNLTFHKKRRWDQISNVHNV